MKKLKFLVKSYLCGVFRSRRLEAGVTQEEMAEVLSITARSYGSLERGESSCSAETLVFFLNHLPDEEALRMIHELARRMLEFDAEEIG